jgi:RecB family exonuclease
MKSWSYSAVKSFETCPLKYYEVAVLKKYPFQETEAARYGVMVHKMAEDFVRDGTPLPKNLEAFERALQVLRNIPGDKHCELKMGVTADWHPCDFFDSYVWARGIVDLLIVKDDLAYIVDYKTGSNKYPDKKQLELMALMTFTHFPKVQRAKSTLLFLQGPALVKASYTREQAPELIDSWQAKARRIADAHKNNRWPPRQNGLCKSYCPVETCTFNGANWT